MIGYFWSVRLQICFVCILVLNILRGAGLGQIVGLFGPKSIELIALVGPPWTGGEGKRGLRPDMAAVPAPPGNPYPGPIF